MDNKTSPDQTKTSRGISVFSKDFEELIIKTITAANKNSMQKKD